MNSVDYATRLQSILSRIVPVFDTLDKHEVLSLIDTGISEIRDSVEEETVKMQLLDGYKSQLLRSCKDALLDLQVEFVSSDDPDSSDSEMFKKYLNELKEYKQDLISPSSELHHQISSILRRSKTDLISDINNQSILFPTECLDSILSCPEVEQENGANWVVSQINEGLSALLEDVNLRLEATFEAVSDLLGSKIEALESEYGTQTIDYCQSGETTVSDNVFSVARQALPALGVGGISTTLIGTLINPVIGVISGLAAGGLFLYKSQSIYNKQKKVAELKTKLAPKINLAMSELKSYVLEQFDSFDEKLNICITNLLNAINQEMQDCVDAIKSCELERQSFYKHQEAIDMQMVSLETYIKQLSLLNTNPFK